MVPSTLALLLLLVATLLPEVGAVEAGGAPPVCGDVNADGNVDIGDPVYLLAWLFAGGPPPSCPDGSCADTNAYESVKFGDPIRLLNWLFLGKCPDSGGGTVNTSSVAVRRLARRSYCRDAGMSNGGLDHVPLLPVGVGHPGDGNTRSG